MFGRLQLEENNAALEWTGEPRLVYSTGREINNPFGKLAALQLNSAI
ncbi:hypothetical protein [Paenibacillus soyae]|uniref:Uncharacterized protein n=1 Tax=Paenibacillus soyae TaxID=2969249 RepID=A0A9X2S8X5_9BACL|nr:hypothetical protein [Paenibacillus soyae]MCR2804546.1 hypothetical protein [Paenibacillus soyae]